MTELLPPIDFLVTSTGSWAIHDDKHFEASFIQDWGADVIVSDTYLQQAHPMFPEVLRAVIALQDEYRMDVPIAGSLAAASLKLLRGELICFIDVEGQNSYFSRVTSLFIDDDIVGVVGSNYIVESVEINGGAQEIVSFQQFGTVNVPRTLLDARFPGWEQRYGIGVELGVELEDLMPTVFEKSNALALNMAGVSFP